MTADVAGAAGAGLTVAGVTADVAEVTAEAAEPRPR